MTAVVLSSLVVWSVCTTAVALLSQLTKSHVSWIHIRTGVWMQHTNTCPQTLLRLCVDATHKHLSTHLTAPVCGCNTQTPVHKPYCACVWMQHTNTCPQTLLRLCVDATHKHLSTHLTYKGTRLAPICQLRTSKTFLKILLHTYWQDGFTGAQEGPYTHCATSPALKASPCVGFAITTLATPTGLNTEDQLPEHCHLNLQTISGPIHNQQMLHWWPADKNIDDKWHELGVASLLLPLR